MKVKIMNRNESKKEIRVSEAQTPYTYALVNLMYQLHEGWLSSDVNQESTAALISVEVPDEAVMPIKVEIAARVI